MQTPYLGPPEGRSEPCDATLQHAHGVSQCFDLPKGHEGKHEGVCDICDEAGDYTVLHWTGEGRTVWPI